VSIKLQDKFQPIEKRPYCLSIIDTFADMSMKCEFCGADSRSPEFTLTTMGADPWGVQSGNYICPRKSCKSKSVTKRCSPIRMCKPYEMCKRTKSNVVYEYKMETAIAFRHGVSQFGHVQKIFKNKEEQTITPGTQCILRVQFTYLSKSSDKKNAETCLGNPLDGLNAGNIKSHQKKYWKENWNTDFAAFNLSQMKNAVEEELIFAETALLLDSLIPRLHFLKWSAIDAKRTCVNPKCEAQITTVNPKLKTCCSCDEALVPKVFDELDGMNDDAPRRDPEYVADMIKKLASEYVKKLEDQMRHKVGAVSFKWWW